MLQYLDVIAAKGRDYHYVRFKGKRRRVKDAAGKGLAPNDPGFLAAYEATLAALRKDAKEPRRQAPDPNTLGWLFEQWRRSRQFEDYAEATRTLYKGAIDRDLAPFHKAPLSDLSPGRVEQIMDTASPARANQLRAIIGAAWTWGLKRELIEGENPSAGVAKRKIQDSWRSWTAAELERFEAKATGTAYLAFMLALYTGQRKADILRMRWDWIEGGYIRLTQQKTGKEVFIPIHKRLKAALDKAPRKGLTIVQREDGQPYTVSGFNAIWRRAKQRLKVEAPFHGLRKSAVEVLLEAGASVAGTAAITGQTLEMVEHYAARRDQKRLARKSMDAWEKGGEC